MSTHISGTFEVTVTPAPPSDSAADATIGRMVLTKQFQGELDASSRGEMLAIRSAVQGSAGYVALERVSGKLQGRSGTFALQHSGTMNRGKPSLTITVVPDSGTDALTGLAGTMTIDIVDGKHFYGFDYTLEGE